VNVRKLGYINANAILNLESQGTQINEAACDLAREIADQSGSLVAAGVSQTPVFPLRHDEAEVKAIIQKQLDAFRKKDIDFYMVEVSTEHPNTSFIDTRWTHN